MEADGFPLTSLYSAKLRSAGCTFLHTVRGGEGLIFHVLIEEKIPDSVAMILFSKNVLSLGFQSEYRSTG